MPEAIHGPGGWCGPRQWTFHEFPDLQLIWHDAEVARTHLTRGYDTRTWTDTVTFADLLDWLTTDGIRVELR